MVDMKDVKIRIFHSDVMIRNADAGFIDVVSKMQAFLDATDGQFLGHTITTLENEGGMGSIAYIPKKEVASPPNPHLKPGRRHC